MVGWWFTCFIYLQLSEFQQFSLFKFLPKAKCEYFIRYRTSIGGWHPPVILECQLSLYRAWKKVVYGVNCHGKVTDLTVYPSEMKMHREVWSATVSALDPPPLLKKLTYIYFFKASLTVWLPVLLGIPLWIHGAKLLQLVSQHAIYR